ncbi:unnamed protein product [Parnassius apollo]|uniref:(apollo) hypothetical protein n=1 Tax=Parnassius apollo TaxID=110799 RepID=A0A8S3XTB1_PARAO|nr:unnamed protein product [Parnassius apollo]
MPPTTAAEKQKKYRDKLKKENPQKYEEIQKKAKERSAHETQETYTRELEEKTPRKEVTEFISNNIPNIETPKKEEVKKKLLEDDVLTKSLKLQFQTANNTEKNVLRKVLDNNIVKKYKLKTRLRTSLGFKKIKLKVGNEELSAKVSWFTWILKNMKRKEKRRKLKR